MQSGDSTAALQTFAPDAVLRSPLTDRLAFRGPEQLALLIPVLIEVLQDLTYADVVLSGSRGFVRATACIGDRQVEIVDHLRFDTDGLIEEFTAFFRPLPASAVALQRIGGGLGRRHSRGLGLLMTTATKPLVAIAGAGDRVGIQLIRRSMQPT
jgi:hypothetical protein